MNIIFENRKQNSFTLGRSFNELLELRFLQWYYIITTASLNHLGK